MSKSQSKHVSGYITKKVITSEIKCVVEITQEVILVDHSVSDLNFVHMREPSVPKCGNIKMAIYLNTEKSPFTEVLDFIDQMGHQPANFAEVECLRLLPRKEISCLFAMADDHAKDRRLKRSGFDAICLPVLGTYADIRVEVEGSKKRKKKRFVPVLKLSPGYGIEGYDFYPAEEVEDVLHPAWMIPVVAKS